MYRVHAIVVRWDRNEQERHLVETFNTLNKAQSAAEKAEFVWEGGIDGPRLRLFTSEIVRFEIEPTPE